MKHKIKKVHHRWHSTWGKGTIVIGMLMIFLAWLIYKYFEYPFLKDSYPQILGFGIILVIAGMIFTFFGKKMDV
jgi:hypothetical protein